MRFLEEIIKEQNEALAKAARRIDAMMGDREEYLRMLGSVRERADFIIESQKARIAELEARSVPPSVRLVDDFLSQLRRNIDLFEGLRETRAMRDRAAAMPESLSHPKAEGNPDA